MFFFQDDSKNNPAKIFSVTHYFKYTLPLFHQQFIRFFHLPVCGCDRCRREDAPIRWGRVQQLVSANSRASGRGSAADRQSLRPITEDCGRGSGCGRCVRRYESPAAHYPSRRVNGTSVALRCLDQLQSARYRGKLRLYFFLFLYFFFLPFWLSR